VPVPARRLVPETFIAAFLVTAAAVMSAGYLLDAVGLAIDPLVLGITALIAGAWALVAFREDAPACPEPAPASRGACPERAPASRGAPAGSLALFSCLVCGSLGYFLWLASPSLLPVTNGPDVVHHLLLIHVIYRTHHLVHDPALGPYLLEMTNYTPGSHIAAAAVGWWLRVDPLRVLLPITALFVAVKVGIVYVLALRLVPAKPGASLLALAAPALLAVPAAYVLGSFFQFFYYAQVLSETFAMGMVVAAVGWTRTGVRRYLWLASACAVGVFLSWPVWLVPAGAAVLMAIVAQPDQPPLTPRRSVEALRAKAEGRTHTWIGVAVVVTPVALLGVLHASTHPGGAAIIGSSGAVTQPSAGTLGVVFVALGVVGALLAFRSTLGRPPAVLFAVTILQALVLAAFDARAGSRSFYMPFKMVYLAVLPCAVLGAVALATASVAIALRLPRGRSVAVVAPLIIAALLARGRLPVKRQHSPISESVLAAGLFARSAVPPGCVDYFSAHWLTGYWLHLDVLGNPRLSDRMRAETFDFPDSVGKWIQGKGLPYAIVEDLAAIPRDARVDMIPVRQFGPAALVKNTRPAPCSPRGLTPK
jgi:hypothetical protein